MRPAGWMSGYPTSPVSWGYFWVHGFSENPGGWVPQSPPPPLLRCKTVIGEYVGGHCVCAACASRSDRIGTHRSPVCNLTTLVIVSVREFFRPLDQPRSTKHARKRQDLPKLIPTGASVLHFKCDWKSRISNAAEANHSMSKQNYDFFYLSFSCLCAHYCAQSVRASLPPAVPHPPYQHQRAFICTPQQPAIQEP